MKVIVLPHTVRKTKDGAYVAEIDWCKILSHRGHRHCPGCGRCECHNTFDSRNYNGTTEKQRKNRLAKVRRLG